MSLTGFKAQNHRQQTGKRGALDKVDDRRTPDSLWQPLDDEFGFTLDVAASPENAKCKRYFTLENNGLTRRWSGSVWCNPPYSDCGAWVEKARGEWSELNACWYTSPIASLPRPSTCDCEYCNSPRSIVMLLPANRTEQRWWQDLVEPDRRKGIIEMRFLAGRLRFDVPDGTYSDPRGNRPPFGCVLLIWRRR